MFVHQMKTFFGIGFAGFWGALARYYFNLWTLNSFGTNFPVGILVINILGSLAMGFLMGLGTQTDFFSHSTRLILTTGFLGAFTTFSAFSFDTIAMASAGRWAPAIGNVLLNLVGALVAAAAGMKMASQII